MRTIEDVIQSLSLQNVDGTTGAKIDQLRDACHNFARLIDLIVPPGRPKSIAYTSLEECLMWGIKGLALGDENQKMKAPE